MKKNPASTSVLKLHRPLPGAKVFVHLPLPTGLPLPLPLPSDIRLAPFLTLLGVVIFQGEGEQSPALSDLVCCRCREAAFAFSPLTQDSFLCAWAEVCSSFPAAPPMTRGGVMDEEFNAVKN